MRRLFPLCWLILCILWVHIALGQENIASPAPSQTPAIVSVTPVPLVWVNTHSRVYHYAGTRWYGGTEQGKYVSETEALAEGDRAARNEHHPSASFASPAGLAPSPMPSALAGEAAAPAPSTELLSTCITAIAAQSDPAKLAPLGERGAQAHYVLPRAGSRRRG